MNSQNLLIIGFLGFIGVVASIALLSTFSLLMSPTANSATLDVEGKSTRMSLTPFDRELAIKFMDADHDGRCDACGMDVELCMSSGQIQCNMDPKSTIGVLGSQHIHTDWKIFINGKELDESFLESLAMDMSKMGSPVTSSFIHLDKGAPIPEKTGDVLHMHATGVPLWIFFGSVGMNFDKNCLILLNQEKFCNDGKNILKFYVNGKPNEKWENYVFNDLDKILISYGSEVDLSKQLTSITDFAKNH